MVGFEKALGAVKVIKDQTQYRSKSLLNLARGFFTSLHMQRHEYSLKMNVFLYFKAKKAKNLSTWFSAL